VRVWYFFFFLIYGQRWFQCFDVVFFFFYHSDSECGKCCLHWFKITNFYSVVPLPESALIWRFTPPSWLHFHHAVTNNLWYWRLHKENFYLCAWNYLEMCHFETIHADWGQAEQFQGNRSQTASVQVLKDIRWSPETARIIRCSLSPGLK
jgi:hypothetical protein